MIAAARGARVIAVDPSPAALALAERFGAAATRPDTDPTALADLTGGGPHVTLDAIGSAAVLRDCVAALRPRGRHVQVGLLVEDETVPPVPMARVLARELELYGSHGMGAGEYPAMLAEIADGRLDPGALVTSHITLDDLAGPDGALARMGTQPPAGTAVVVF
jgi:alcohol dehydrogenase